MEILRDVLVVLHLLGMAIIIGGYFATIKKPRVMPGMLHGAYLQLVTGLLLTGLAEMGDGDVNHVKIGIKVVLAILVTVFAFLGNRKNKLAVGSARSAGDGTITEVSTATEAHLVAVFALLAVIVAVFV